jgi:hypothetical protein
MFLALVISRPDSKVFAVLGSGFGLYGYLPALVEGCGQSIVLPERYRISFQARPELEKFSHAVRWESDECSALGCAEGAVLALRPADQEFWLYRCLGKPNLKFLILEKPLARTPEGALSALDALLVGRKIFRIGYVFRFTAWGRQLLSVLGAKNYSGKLLIQWSFCAHHYQHDLSNWKRFVSMGGGAIRFFGIHVIALLAELGYQDIVLSKTFGASPDEIERWSASVTGPGLPECELMIDTRSARTTFQVMCSRGINGNPDFRESLSSPLDSNMVPESHALAGLDSRTLFLSQLFGTLKEVGDGEFVWYQRTLNLWLSAESTSYFELVHADTIKPDFMSIT